MTGRAQHANVTELTGRSPGKDSGGREIPKPPSFMRTAPSPPEELEGRALEVWNQTAPELVRLKLVKDIDAHALAAYCQAVQTFWEAVASVKEDGIRVTNVTTYKDGTVTEREVPNPAVAVQFQAGSQIRQYAQEFGLTPAAEMKLATKAGKGDDPDENPFEGA